jgi:DNA-binding MarR family transcriptional regulator
MKGHISALFQDWRKVCALEYTTGTMELLSRLLGGQERVKIMRYFLYHDEAVVSASTVADKTKSKSASARKELNALSAVGFIEKKKGREFVTGKGKNAVTKVKDIMGYKLNPEFPHNQALKDLLFDFELLDKRELANRFKPVGRIKLFVVSGVFLSLEDSRVDILLVGEAIKKPKAEKVFEALSAELGREVIYSVMDVQEYMYRYKMYDKFVRDILDMPHEKVIDKLSEKVLPQA